MIYTTWEVFLFIYQPLVQQRELDYVELSTDAQVPTEELNYRNYSQAIIVQI